MIGSFCLRIVVIWVVSCCFFFVFCSCCSVLSVGRIFVLF